MSVEGTSNVERTFAAYSIKMIKGGKNSVQTASINELVRELGYAPSIKELDEFAKSVGDQCDLSTLKTFLDKIDHTEDTHNNFMELFRFYDPEKTGKVSKKLLQRILTNVGETLDDDEIKRFFGTLSTDDDDEIVYEDLINK
ncbi:hypothetical protein BEWA_011500 [Theileria equi strain WA]|uniref:Calmodulin n=1 Tax=Theileria equi strain WA TaxID=1537102 RepID=L0B1I7_THEEQ|nr:hypothetical protein BEWA_011500 [Theileria equi strain WA]AFZ81732.1 hypothetical protein BEWA_011500 [Theileria equi strain WA]|eukprot:XP_004831398.1 hypothetical protein BEWA_011500 [Theileria equi strain WA]